MFLNEFDISHTVWACGKRNVKDPSVIRQDRSPLTVAPSSDEEPTMSVVATSGSPGFAVTNLNGDSRDTAPGMQNQITYS
jgi:hypothetical protein